MPRDTTEPMPDRIIPHYPLERRWQAARIPANWVFPESSRLPWITTKMTGPNPLDITRSLTNVCSDIIGRLPEFAHIDMTRVRVTFTPSRSPGPYGLQARLTPMRLKHGAREHSRRGRRYSVQRYLIDDVELLYLITFALPRYLDRPFEDKLVTIVHELHHIGEAFDGDIRRYSGRYHAHSHSKCEYDDEMNRLTNRYLATNPDPATLEFLHRDYADLWKRHGGIFGAVLPRPKLVPVESDQPVNGGD